MYYRLKEPWAFQGWKKLPFAIRAMEGEKKHEIPILLKKEPFLELLCCNGEENVEISDFSEKGQRLIRKMIKTGLMEQSPNPLPPLAPYQRYHVYPSRYIKQEYQAMDSGSKHEEDGNRCKELDRRLSKTPTGRKNTRRRFCAVNNRLSKTEKSDRMKTGIIYPLNCYRVVKTQKTGILSEYSDKYLRK